MKRIFVGSTGQHVGKTTTSLGLFSGMRKHLKSVGFIKPVGQEHVEVAPGLSVDKDVSIFQDRFELKDSPKDMSPVLFPRGFTRDFLDHKIDENELKDSILSSYERIQSQHEGVVIEGTGHVGVGSIVNLSNARVAKLLNVDMVLVASGGLGSSFDALALNKSLCDHYGVKIRGVILNMVIESKRDMVMTYMKKALSRWDIPIVGCIPYDPFLSNPTMKDFEMLFNATLLSGEEHHMRHFRQTRLVATSLETYKELIVPSQLVITPSNREDIVLATLEKHWDYQKSHPQNNFGSGMILTGDNPPSKSIVEELKKANIPMMYVPLHSYQALQKITSYTVKIQKEDIEKVSEAISVVERHIDFNRLLMG